MEKLALLLERLRSGCSATEEDTVWKRWVDLKPRGTMDLVDLLSQHVNDNFKRRALFLLFVPPNAENLLYWKNPVGKFDYGADILDKLDPELLICAAELTKQFVATVRPLHCDRPKNVAEGGGGIRVYMSIPDRYHDALSFYNCCILKLLEKLPAEQASGLFPLYSLNDISTFSNMEEASGYKPFQKLMYSEGIDERWKRAADEGMREIIRAEIAGQAMPRKDWENALRCYSRFIQMQFQGLCYSKELLIDQARFLVENLQPNTRLIDDWHVINFFELLSADFQGELRHKIARYVVIENPKESGGFHTYTTETRQAAGWMLKEFRDDQELAEKVRACITEDINREVANAAHQAEKQEAERSIFEAMK